MKHHIGFDLEFKTHKYPGKFVVIEGNETAGKSVQVDKVFEKLKSQKFKVVITKEPTDSPIGKLIRGVLSRKVKASTMALQYLYCADRVMHLKEVEKLLKEGYIVISDRYFWSSVAFGVADLGKEGAKEEEFYLIAFSILSMYHQFLLPDLTIYLDIDLKTAIQRLKQSEKHTEIYDNEIMWPKIQKGYDFLLRRFPNEITKIDGKRSVEEVTEDIVERIKKI